MSVIHSKIKRSHTRTSPWSRIWGWHLWWVQGWRQEHCPYSWRRDLPQQDIANKLYNIWCEIGQWYHQANYIPRYNGQVPRNRSKCATFLVCACDWNLPCARVVVSSRCQEYVTWSNGDLMGAMVQCQAWLISAWISPSMPSQDWLCGVLRWVCIYFSWPQAGDLGCLYHTCILRRVHIDSPASYKVCSMSPEPWWERWLGQLLCEHVSLRKNVYEYSLMAISSFADQDLLMRHFGHGIGHLQYRTQMQT